MNVNEYEFGTASWDSQEKKGKHRRLMVKRKARKGEWGWLWAFFVVRTWGQGESLLAQWARGCAI